MLYVSTDIRKFHIFKNLFIEEHSGKRFIDLSKVPSTELYTESSTIIKHHTNVAIFLGYLEPGWMIEATHQTLLRNLFRKFPVGLVVNFVESLPHSWKNEIGSLYTDKPLNNNGVPDSINDGCAVQYEHDV